MQLPITPTPKSLADAIVASGLTTTYCYADQLPPSADLPGGRAARTVLQGKLNPAAPFPSLTDSRATLSADFVARYGQGFGLPVQQDVSVLPAISLIPTEADDNYGWEEEENWEQPNTATLTALGFPGGYAFTAQDRTDCQACRDFEEQVVKPLNRGLAVGTPLPTPTTVVPPKPPTQSAPVAPSSPAPTTAVLPAPVAVSALTSAHFAKVWPGLRTAILAAHGVVAPTIRADIYGAFMPALAAMAESGLIAADGTLVGG